MKKGFIDPEILVLISIVLSILGVVTFLAVNIFIPISYETGSGKQTGYVSAVEKSGVLFKTGRAYIKPTLESTQEDIYCVMDDRILEELEKISVEKKRVEITHFSWLSTGLKCNHEDAVISTVIEI